MEIPISQFIEMFNGKGYPEKQLSEVCKKITDGAHKTPKYLGEGVTFISAKNIINGRLDFSDIKYISESEYQEIQKRCQTEKGDVLLAKSGSLGMTAIVENDESLGLFESLAILKYDRMLLNGVFLCRQMQSDAVQSQLMSNVKGVAVKHLHLNVISKTKIIVPPMDLQERFCAFARQSDKSKFACLKSQFIEMFGLPECNTHEYEIATIGDVVKDVHYGTAKKASEDGRYIYIRMNNITYDGELDLTDIKRIDVPEKDIAGCMVQEGDVLFNRTNSKDLVGKTCHFTGNEPMIIAGYIIRLRMNGKVLPEYISTFMNLDRSKKMLYSMAKGAVGQANINAKEVQSIPIVIPPENVQQEFLKLRKQSDKSK